ncbi:MarR family transcriptional regulator [Streptomyces zinciresistens K42]|uniref:MarR family transcriptional regulator n=1 Tax=Streptomyces zinciresistens K42 TaxID=700597 RepID=G2GGT4_9ACTN|nr:MarR family transcriptional regulator [Streptomyces zinciresistens]EGX57280.1 MarR family transcriptional regulator [Streptomyces zinciresistens K42]
MHDLLVSQAGRSMQSQFGLSATDYKVLAELTRSADDRLRVLELARLLGWEKSRVSHHVARMTKRDLVDREECADDGRGAYVRVTPAGRAALEMAAPQHVADVRRLFLDHMTPGQTALLAEIADSIIEKLDPQQ